MVYRKKANPGCGIRRVLHSLCHVNLPTFSCYCSDTFIYTSALSDAATDPDLEFNAFVLPKDCLDLEVNADCTDKRRRERVVGVAEKERRFADATVAND